MGYLDIAAGEVGYRGNPENHTKYWADLKPAWQGSPWCFTFVSWCLWKAGQLAAIGGKPLYYCPTGVNMAKARGQWRTSPAVGDLVFYDYGGTVAAHIEFVTGVGSGSIQAIGGNTSGDLVARKTRSFGSIMGYWRLNAVPGSGAGEPGGGSGGSGGGSGGGVGYLSGTLLPAPTETIDAMQESPPSAWFTSVRHPSA